MKIADTNLPARLQYVDKRWHYGSDHPVGNHAHDRHSVLQAKRR
jgi:hypothetical protein